MKREISALLAVALSAAFFVAGCTSGTPTAKPKATLVAEKHEKKLTAEEAEIKTNLAQLNAEDRKLAEAQKWCAVDNENPLGEMGVPFKVMVKGEPVFLCCGSCKKTAQKDPDKTLATVAALKLKAKGDAK